MPETDPDGEEEEAFAAIQLLSTTATAAGFSSHDKAALEHAGPLMSALADAYLSVFSGGASSSRLLAGDTHPTTSQEVRLDDREGGSVTLSMPNLRHRNPCLSHTDPPAGPVGDPSTCPPPPFLRTSQPSRWLEGCGATVPSPSRQHHRLPLPKVGTMGIPKEHPDYQISAHD